MQFIYSQDTFFCQGRAKKTFSVQWVGGWVVGLNGNIAISAQSLAWAWAELGKKNVSGNFLIYVLLGIPPPLPLPNGMVAHALTYWPNVGPFGPSLPQPPNLTSLRKLQYTSARTNVTHASIVAHAT